MRVVPDDSLCCLYYQYYEYLFYSICHVYIYCSGLCYLLYTTIQLLYYYYSYFCALLLFILYKEMDVTPYCVIRYISQIFGNVIFNSPTPAEENAIFLSMDHLEMLSSESMFDSLCYHTCWSCTDEKKTILPAFH